MLFYGVNSEFIHSRLSKLFMDYDKTHTIYLSLFSFLFKLEEIKRLTKEKRVIIRVVAFVNYPTLSEISRKIWFSVKILLIK